MKRKATPIKEGSCSRIARPQKALDRRAQSRPSSTVSPKKKGGGESFGQDFIDGFFSRKVQHDFKRGLSVYEVATRYGFTINEVEALIRKAMKEMVRRP